MNKLVPQSIPQCFKRKMVWDGLVELEASKPVVDMAEYKRAKKHQEVAFKECESWQFPSKSK